MERWKQGGKNIKKKIRVKTETWEREEVNEEGNDYRKKEEEEE